MIQVSGHFVPWSFRTQVISCHFGYFYFQFGHFIPTSVISFPVWILCTRFNVFRQNYLVILYQFLAVSYPRHFVPKVVSLPIYSFVPRSFHIHIKSGLYCTIMMVVDVFVDFTFSPPSTYLSVTHVLLNALLFIKILFFFVFLFFFFQKYLKGLYHWTDCFR